MKILDRIMTIFEHLTIILALAFLTFAILDWYNPMMGFATNALSAKLMIAFCLITIITNGYRCIRKAKNK